MEERIKFVKLNKSEKKSNIDDFNYEKALIVNNFHKSFPEYKETPLVSLDELASQLNVKSIRVKDESFRFNLNAFKVLGGSFAIGNYIANKLNMDIKDLPYEKMTSDEIRSKLGEVTFITATDGNHGRGIAWTANRLKQNSVVYMPKGSAKERLDNIKALGSDASITELNYDEAVRKAYEDASKNGWVFIQDTTQDGYYDIPLRIMQGYMSMGLEAYRQIDERPTHIFLQAGVGAMAGAMTAFFSNVYKDEKPIITIIEPNKADCIFKKAEANDGKLHFVTGDMDSIMAGLCCGEPCTIGWNILKDYAENYISMPDYVAAKGMRVLANNNVVSGESGASTIGFVNEVLTNFELDWLKSELKLDENSRILCFSTEGDTDKENYEKIINNEIFK